MTAPKALTAARAAIPSDTAISFNRESGEYAVYFRYQTNDEATYYTDDLQDAIDTARTMSAIRAAHAALVLDDTQADAVAPAPYDSPSALFAALKAAPIGHALPITPALYDYFLGVLPPLRMGHGGFDFAEGADRITHFTRDEWDKCAAAYTDRFSRG